MIYRDFYGYPPGRYILFAYIFKYFGISLNIVRIVVSLFTALMPLLIFSISKKIMNPRYSLLVSCIVLSAPGMYYSRFFPFFLLLTLWAIIRFIGKRSISNTILLGIVILLSSAFKAEIGIIGIMVVSLLETINYIFIRGQEYSKDRWKAFLAAALLIIFIVIITVFSNDHILFVISYTLNQVFKIRHVWSNPIPNLLSSQFYNSFNEFLDNILYYLSLGSYIGILVYILIKTVKGKFENISKHFIIFIISIVGLSAYGLIWWRAGFDNLLRAIPPFYILLGFILYSLERYIRRRFSNQLDSILSSLISLASMSIIFLYIFHFNFNHGFYAGSIGALRENNSHIKNSMLDIYCTSYDDFVIRKVIDYIKKNSGQDDYIFSIPLNPLWYFLSERKNPTFYEWILPGAFRNDKEELSVIETLERKRPILIIYVDIAIDNREERRFSVYANKIYNYMHKNYIIKNKIGLYQIYMRKDHSSG